METSSNLRGLGGVVMSSNLRDLRGVVASSNLRGLGAWRQVLISEVLERGDKF